MLKITLRTCILALFAISLVSVTPPTRALADDEFRREDSSFETGRSPKQGWGDFRVVSVPTERPRWQRVLLWIPNRVFDFVNIFRVDVGVGPAIGGVVRATKYVQGGYRVLSPTSIRVGDFGRGEAPYLVEGSNEFGLTPVFHQSKDRTVCKAEFGVGLDLFVGGYVGICGEGLVDFVAGIFTFDPLGNDLK